MLRRTQSAAGCLLLLALAGVGYGFLLVPGRVPYSPHSDIVAYHLAAKQVLHDSLEAGHGVPFWRSDQLSGTPAFTSPNALYTNPLHGLFYLFDPVQATGPTLFLLLVVGALAYYAVALSLKLGPWPRLFMAVAGLFNFKVIMAAYAGWLGPMCAIAAFPLLFASAFAMTRRPTLSAGLVLAASVALCLHGGQLQIVFYAGWFVSIYLGMSCLRDWRSDQRPRAYRMAGYALAAVLLAFAMSLYVLWPMAAEASLVSRVQASEAFLQSGHDLGLRHLLTLFSPEILGTPLDGSYAGSELWEDVAYFGLVPLALAGAGVGLAWRRPEVRFLAVGFALSLLLALDSPIVRLAYAVVPGLRLFRLPGRILFVTAFFGVTLAGVGLHELRERLSRRSHRGAAWVSVALFAIMAGEGVAYAHRYLDTAPASFVRPDTDLGQFLSADRSTFRVAPVGRTAVSYGSAAAMGLELVTGYEPYNLSRYQQYFRLLQSGADGGNEAAVWTDLHQVERWDLLDALNVKYLLSSHPLTLPADRFQFVQRFERQPVYVLYKGVRQTDVWLYRNLRARTRAYFVEKVAVVPNHGAALAMLAKSSLDGLAIVEEVSFAGHLGVPSPTDRARVAKAAGGFVEVDTLSETERYLVVSESWHPGWRGFLDGKEIPLHIADVTLLGASIPAGMHHLTLMFRPLHFSAAIATSLVALGLFLLGIMRWIQKGLRERRRGEDEPLAKAIAQERTVDAL